MTFPTPRLSTLALCLAPFMMGCPGETTTDTDDDDTEVEGTDTPEYFEPDFAGFAGFFAYDAATNQARGYQLPDGTAAPIVFVIDLSYGGATADNDDYCSFIWTTETAVDLGSWVTAADAVTDQSVYFGFTMPADATVQTDCGDWDFDPNVWGTNEELIATITGWEWGMGISNLPTATAADLEEAVIGGSDQANWDDNWDDKVIGAGFHWGAINEDGGYLNWQFSRPLAVDENFAIQYDDANSNDLYDDGEEFTSLTATDIQDGTVPSGVYSVTSFQLGIGATCLLGLEFCPQ